MRINKIFTCLLCYFIIISCQIKSGDPLKEGFREPPSYTKPWVYWYWIDENISSEGITKDIEAMARVGIGQALIGHVSPGNQRGNVRILSKNWWGMVEHAVKEGLRLGVNIGFFNGPGWSQSGGPWINTYHAMRYVVSHEIQLKGPRLFKGKLSYPDTSFERIALQAFPMPKKMIEQSDPIILAVNSNPVNSEIKNLFDQDTSTQFIFPDKFSSNENLSIDIHYKASTSVQSIQFEFLPIPFYVELILQSKDQTGEFRDIRQFTIDRRNINFQIGPMRYNSIIFSLPETFSDHFRLILSHLTGNQGAGFKNIDLKPEAVIDQVIEKQLGKMYSDPLPPWDAYQWPSQAELVMEDIINPDDIINLTSIIDPDGNIQWEVPEGDWILIHTGMIPTGSTNVPVPIEATGFESDKFSKEAIEIHFDSFIGEFFKRVSAEERQSLKTIVVDSYEVGPQNWTEEFENIFIEHYGYDPVPWLPVFNGWIVKNADLSNRFLWDIRRLTADLISNVYVNRLKELSNEHGMDLWLENYGHWGFPGEFLQYGGNADLVSGEFWYENPFWDLGPLECRAASSTSHTYGKTLVFAEAFTAGFNFKQYPAVMKSRGDQMFCEGINHFVHHVYIHQPWEDRKPGVTAWFGMSYERNNTWFEQSIAWNDYFKRCHFLLQQGLPVSDVCYFIGEDAPKMTGILDPALPTGFDYDFINADVILNRLSVRDDKLILPDGKSYQLLVLPPLPTMRPQLLKRISQLLEAGARVYGPPPSFSPSLENYPIADDNIKSMARDLWGKMDGITTTSKKIGAGYLYYGQKLDQVFEKLKLDPDILCTDTTILWKHRKTGNTDIYFISNQEERYKIAEISFRISGKIPELWHPDTGKANKTAWYNSKNERTIVPVNLTPYGSVFLIFRDQSNRPSVVSIQKDNHNVLFEESMTLKVPEILYTNENDISFKSTATGNYSLLFSDGDKKEIKLRGIPPSLNIKGPWKVQFPENWDVPVDTLFYQLISWTDHQHVGIQHFSGTASYHKKVTIPDEMIRADLNVILDLGEVKMLAEVILNDENIGILWHEPFAVDITEVIRSGENDIMILITNTWWNRLIGDQRFPTGFPGSDIDQPRTYTTHKAWNAEDDLMPSGLLGPVRIIVEKEVVFKKE